MVGYVGAGLCPGQAPALPIEIQSHSLYIVGVNTEDSPPRVLIVEDDASIRRVISRVFRDGYEVHEAADGLEGLDKARELSPSVIITDQRMPKLTGVELLAAVKEIAPRTVRILVTGYAEYGPLVDAVNAAHVHHYVEKPFHARDLRTVVDALCRTATLERERVGLLKNLEDTVGELEDANRRLRDSEANLATLVRERTLELQNANENLERANQSLREMAIRDSLTGLFNHRCLMDHLELELARSERYGREFVVLFIDIDEFKSINDGYGHAMGDAVLRQLAETMVTGSHGLRRSDFAARYGGDEFCVLLPETPLAGGRIKAERLREQIEKARWGTDEVSLDRPVTASIGVAAYPDHGSSVSNLLDAADAALYRAKEAGRNRIECASD